MLAVRISRPSTVPHRPHCVAFLTAPRYRLSRMLERLELANVGPAPAMALAPRINLITGDNGLGKSFLLDVAWWALTRNWPRNLNPRLTAGYAARPTNVREPATLRFTVRTATGDSRSYESAYSALDEGWPGRPGRPYNAGLVVYAHVDGGFSVWDPSRNYWQTRGNLDVQDRVPGYVFAPQEVWTGLTVPIKGSLTRVCKGLLDDWSSWIRERGTEADLMTRVLGTLTVQGEPVEVGPIVRLSVNDAQDIPSIRTEYSDAIPIVHASAGVRRIAALAYMLVWSWSEHLRAAEQLGLESTRQIVLLFDEIEAHLHPRWQRAVVPAVLKVMNILSDAHNPKVQLLAATHSPLVLASVEPLFEEECHPFAAGTISRGGTRHCLLRSRDGAGFAKYDPLRPGSRATQLRQAGENTGQPVACGPPPCEPSKRLLVSVQGRPRYGLPLPLCIFGNVRGGWNGRPLRELA